MNDATPPIASLYAWLALDPGEGIMATMIPNMGWSTLTFAKRENAERVRGLVEAMAQAKGVTVSLVEFTRGDTLAVVIPLKSTTKGEDDQCQ